MKRFRKKIIFLILTLIIFFFFNTFFKNSHASYGSNVTDKFIIYECLQKDMCGGWADRLKGILSTYAFSLIMNRTFIMQVNQGCDLIKILHPNKVNWQFDLIPRTRISSVLISLEWKYWLAPKFRSDKELFAKNKDTTLIRIKSGCMLSDNLAINPHFKQKINDLGFEQSKFKIVHQFKKWYGDLFKLNQKLQLKYEHFVSKIKPDNTKLICIQIRIGDIGHVTESNPSITKDFWKFVKFKFLESSKYLDTNFTIYVTADREFVKKEAKKYFANHEVFYIENSSVHVEKEKKKDKCQDLENVVFDFHLMQNCDIGVVSHSGFGIMSMWNRPDPFKDLYVYTKKDQKKFIKDYYNRKNLTFVKFSKLNDIFFV